MPGFLRNLSLDRISFWYGFLTGILTLLIFALIRPFLARLGQWMLTRLQDMRARMTTSAETRLRREMIVLAQHNHLAAPLFSLDEIVIPPQLMALPSRQEPQAEVQKGDDTPFQLPYLPDYPELAAHYGGETISFPQALSGGTSLVVLGGCGYGKSVALAHLTCLVARRDAGIGKLGSSLPVFVHVADLLPAGQFIGQPLEQLEQAILSRSPNLASARLSELLRAAFQHGRALLLLDGLDEQPASIHGEVIKYLVELRKAYPATRLVVSARSDDFSGLINLGLVPVALAAWNQLRQQEFLVRWGKNWRKFIQPSSGNNGFKPEPELLTSWLLLETTFLTPLDLTLKAWAAYTGDILGTSPAKGMNAYIRRLIAGQPKARAALESLALQMVLTLHPTLTEKEARKWTGEIELGGGTAQEGELSENDSENGKDGVSAAVKGSQTRLRGMVSDLVETGILLRHTDGRLGFSHPSVTAYLAACGISENGLVQALVSQPEWIGKTETCAWLATMEDVSALVENYEANNHDPLLRGVLTPARWLRLADRKADWRESLQQILLEVFHSEDWVFSLRLRALLALLGSGEPALGKTLRQMLASPAENSRLLAALGSGFLSEPATTAALDEVLADRSPRVRWAASLALATIGTQKALEALAYALLNGEDGARRCAAEALALHPAEGHAALQEGSEVEDLLVRRAVAFGLAKVDQPWARQILEKMAVDDKEWVVRAAASLALEQLQAPPVNVPAATHNLSEMPWLIAFAGERGLGVAPGKPALQLLLKALQEGNPVQRMAALQSLERYQEPRSLEMIYSMIAESDVDLSQAAFHTMWTMAGSGIQVRNPVLI
jgi:HEAT repeat protein